jgi:hypothetical protein
MSIFPITTCSIHGLDRLTLYLLAGRHAVHVVLIFNFRRRRAQQQLLTFTFAYHVPTFIDSLFY